MSVYVGFKIGKAMERKAYISECYCGACGWPVSDHDSYCPECGGAFRKEDATERTCRNIYDEIDRFVPCANGFTCSECGDTVEDCEGYYVKGTFNFCPNCGAKVVE